MADLDSQWEFSTWISRASVFLQLDDTGSTGMTIHRRTREEKTIYRSVTNGRIFFQTFIQFNMITWGVQGQGPFHIQYILIKSSLYPLWILHCHPLS